MDDLDFDKFLEECKVYSAADSTEEPIEKNKNHQKKTSPAQKPSNSKQLTSFVSRLNPTVVILASFFIVLCSIVAAKVVFSGRSDKNVPDVDSSPVQELSVSEISVSVENKSPLPSQMAGTWRDEVYREGNSWVQFEVIINTDNETVSINTITENARTVTSNAMPITDYGDDFVSAGGYIFTYLAGDVLDVNSALFTNPPLTRYSYETINDAFGVDSSDYRKSSTSTYISDDIKGALWAVAVKGVSSRLKYPDSAKFPFSYGSDGVSIGRNGETYYVEAYVDAVNAFGVVSHMDFMVTAHLDGLTMKLDDVMIFE